MILPQDADSPIASRARNCALLFDQLARLSEHSDKVTKEQAIDEFARYKLWAGNIGALHPFNVKTSLDSRLHDNAMVRKRITGLLDELAESLKEACSIALGATEDHTAESALEDQDELVFDEDDEELSEIGEIFKAIADVIANLFRFSSVIRNNIGRDRYAKAIASAALRFPIDDHYDINHVRCKFPALESNGKGWLAVRLGKAITQRRKYIWYCRGHHATTVEGQQPPFPITQDMPTQGLRTKLAVDGKSVQSKHLSTLAQTQASTLLLPGDALLPEDHLDDENYSQTSYATSVEQDSRNHKLYVVPLATVSQGLTNFECPYCWQVLNIKSQKSWKKHVLTDLKPYVCTFEECEVALFPNQSTWWAHERKMHRREWSCTFCPRKGKVFDSPTDFESHLRVHHAMALGDNFDTQLPQILEMSQQSLGHKIRPECPFCEDWEQTVREQNPQFSQTEAFYIMPEQFKRHLGAHMDQLALFAIPRGAVDDGRSRSSASVRENYQTGSLQSFGGWNSKAPSTTNYSIPETPNIIGLILATIEIVRSTKYLYSALKDFKGQPEEFRRIAAKFPLVLEILRNAKKKALQTQLDDGARNEAESNIRICRDKVEALNRIFREVIRDDDSWLERYKKAVVFSKGKRAEELMREIMEHIKLVISDILVGTTTVPHIEKLQEAIQEMLDMPSSIPDDERLIIQNYRGTGYNNSILNRSTTNILQSLYFPEMDLRIKDIAVENTCEWLCNEPAYKDWLGQSQRLLWIVGTPGSGKSTIMKYIYQQDILQQPRIEPLEGTLHLSQRARKKPILASFFCHFAGAALQKNGNGLFRSLLHQILQQIPKLPPDVVTYFDERCNLEVKPGENLEWHQHDLKQMLQTTISYIAKEYPHKYALRMYVDALDEFGSNDPNGGNEPRELAEYFQSLTSLDILGIDLNVCLSGRDYPSIAKGGLKITVGNKNHRDISNYVQNKLASIQGEGYETQQLIDWIVENASGNFQWAAIIVDKARNLNGYIESPKGILEELTKLSGGLDELD